MTDEELVKRLQNLYAMLEDGGYYTKANTAAYAADRIEALLRECAIRDAATDEGKRLWAEAEARADRLEAALREIVSLNSPEKAWEATLAKDIARATLKGDTK